MEEITLNNITDFLRPYFIQQNSINTDADIFDELGITGDDTSDFLEAYSTKFNVDMADYLWYFHTEEETGVINPFYSAPYEKLGGCISITPRMLADFANKGFWDVKYPEHEFPVKESIATNVARYVIVLLIAGLLFFFAWYNYLKS